MTNVWRQLSDKPTDRAIIKRDALTAQLHSLRDASFALHLMRESMQVRHRSLVATVDYINDAIEGGDVDMDAINDRIAQDSEAGVEHRFVMNRAFETKHERAMRTRDISLQIDHLSDYTAHLVERRESLDAGELLDIAHSLIRNAEILAALANAKRREA